MKFRKYEFTPNQWSELKSKIWLEEYGYSGCHVVELGFLSAKYSVDILWIGEPLSDFTQYEVWPEGVGYHTFSGMDGLYYEAYKEKFPS